MKKIVAALLLTASCGFPCVSSAAPSGATELAPGIYTTAEISRRCQRYTNRRVGSTQGDTERQSVFLACVQRLYGNAYGAPAAPALNEAPVSLPVYAGDRYGACSTDEGYGRRGSCDSF